MMTVLCRLFGHKPVKGPLMRSPYTVYTHWTDTKCLRCGAHLAREEQYRDALTEPELFFAEAAERG